MKCWKCGTKLQKTDYGYYCPKCRHVRKFKRTGFHRHGAKHKQ